MRLRRSSVACFKEGTEVAFFKSCEEQGVLVDEEDTLPKLIAEIDMTLVRQAAQADGNLAVRKVADYLCGESMGHLFKLTHDEP
jgi:hypothetical protein